MVAAAGNRAEVSGNGDGGEEHGEDQQGGAPGVVSEQPAGEREEDARGEAGDDGHGEQRPVAAAGSGGGDDDGEGGLVEARGGGDADEHEHGVQLPHVAYLRPGE